MGFGKWIPLKNNVLFLAPTYLPATTFGSSSIDVIH